MIRLIIDHQIKSEIISLKLDQLIKTYMNNSKVRLTEQKLNPQLDQDFLYPQLVPYPITFLSLVYRDVVMPWTPDVTKPTEGEAQYGDVYNPCHHTCYQLAWTMHV